MNKKIIIGIIIAVIIIIVAAMTLPDMLNDGSNIKLVKEDTGGKAYYDSDGQAKYRYFIDGSMQNMPSNNKFEVKIIAYDQAGSEIKGVNYYPSSASFIKDYASDGKSGEIGAIVSSEPLNISKIDIIVINPDGKIVFQQAVEFDMDNMDLSGLDKKPETSTSSDSSATISDENSTLSVDGQNINYEDVNGNLEVTVENGVYHYKGTYNGISYDYKLDKNGKPVY